jgi:mannose-6-phosphate isomerase-like protein (cupin superfamily)
VPELVDLSRHLAGAPSTAPPNWTNARIGAVNSQVVLHAGGGELEGAWHRQDSDEVLIVLKGGCTVEGESGPTTAGPGQCVLVSAHERHRVTCLPGTVLVAVEGCTARRYD